MTVTTAELAQNVDILLDYDYLEIEDTGLFLSPKYADELKDILQKKIADQKKRELDEMMQFAGAIKIDPKYINATSKELRHARSEKYIEK